MRRMMAPNTSSACARAERRDGSRCSRLWRKNFNGAIGKTVADRLGPCVTCRFDSVSLSLDTFTAIRYTSRLRSLVGEPRARRDAALLGSLVRDPLLVCRRQPFVHKEERVTSLLRCAAALVAVFSFSLPVQIQSSVPGFSGPRDTRSAARVQTPVVAGGSAANALTPAERAAGWTLLFDGRSLAGWQPSGQAVWSVEDGMIISRGKAPGISQQRSPPTRISS